MELSRHPHPPGVTTETRPASALRRRMAPAGRRETPGGNLERNARPPPKRLRPAPARLCRTTVDASQPRRELQNGDASEAKTIARFPPVRTLKIKTERKRACTKRRAGDRADPRTRRARGGCSSSGGAYRVLSFRAEALDRGEPASLASRGRPRRSSRLFREADLGARGVFRAPRSRWGRTRRPPVAPRRPRRRTARETRPRRHRRERRTILRSSCRDRPRRPRARTRASPVRLLRRLRGRGAVLRAHGRRRRGGHHGAHRDVPAGHDQDAHADRGDAGERRFFFLVLSARHGVPRAAAAAVIETEGVRGLYRGVAAVGIGVGPAHAVYFATYEHMKRTLGGRKKASTTLSRTRWQAPAPP